MRATAPGTASAPTASGAGCAAWAAAAGGACAAATSAPPCSSSSTSSRTAVTASWRSSSAAAAAPGAPAPARSTRRSSSSRTRPHPSAGGRGPHALRPHRAGQGVRRREPRGARRAMGEVGRGHRRGAPRAARPHRADRRRRRSRSASGRRRPGRARRSCSRRRAAASTRSWPTTSLRAEEVARGGGPSSPACTSTPTAPRIWAHDEGTGPADPPARRPRRSRRGPGRHRSTPFATATA